MAAEPTTDKLAKSALGEDKPINEKRPSTPFAIVAAYPIGLVVILLIILLVTWLSRSWS